MMTNASEVTWEQWKHTMEGTQLIVWGSRKTLHDQVASKLQGTRQRSGSAGAKEPSEAWRLARTANAPGPSTNSEWHASSDRR